MALTVPTRSPFPERKPLSPIQEKSEPRSSECSLMRAPYQPPRGAIGGSPSFPCSDSSAASAASSLVTSPLTLVTSLPSPSEVDTSASSIGEDISFLDSSSSSSDSDVFCFGLKARPESPDPLDNPRWRRRFQCFPLPQRTLPTLVQGKSPSKAEQATTKAIELSPPEVPELPAKQTAVMMRQRPRARVCLKPRYLPRRGNPGRMTEYQRMLNARPATRWLLW